MEPYVRWVQLRLHQFLWGFQNRKRYGALRKCTITDAQDGYFIRGFKTVNGMEPYVSEKRNSTQRILCGRSFKTVNGMEPYVRIKTFDTVSAAAKEAFQNRKRYGALRKVDVVTVDPDNFAQVFQNRKRYGALRKFVNYSLQYRVVIDMFQNRKRYGALRKYRVILLDTAQQGSNGFKTVNGMEPYVRAPCQGA